MGLEKHYHNITPDTFNAVMEKEVNSSIGITHKKEIMEIIKQ